MATDGVAVRLSGSETVSVALAPIRDELDHLTGYATENTTPLTIEEAEALETWVSGITVQPGDGRLAEAHRVSRRFPG